MESHIKRIGNMFSAIWEGDRLDMWFWWFILICDCIIPVLMIIAGRIMRMEQNHSRHLNCSRNRINRNARSEAERKKKETEESLFIKLFNFENFFEKLLTPT